LSDLPRIDIIEKEVCSIVGWFGWMYLHDGFDGRNIGSVFFLITHHITVDYTSKITHESQYFQRKLH